MNARLIEKATTLKTTKGESQNAFKRINQAKVSAIRLTHTGREVSPSGLKTDAGFGGAIASKTVDVSLMALTLVKFRETRSDWHDICATNLELLNSA